MVLREETERSEIKHDEVILLLCHRFNRFNLLNLAQYFSALDFLDFIDKFAGCYVKIPPATKIFEVLDECKMACLYQRMKKAYADRDLKLWDELERQFLLLCKRTHVQYHTGKRIAKTVWKEMQKSQSWKASLGRLQSWQEKIEP